MVGSLRGRSPYFQGGFYYKEPPESQPSLPIDRKYLDCAVFLWVARNFHDAGFPEVVPVGSAFVVSIAEAGLEFAYAATAKHIVERSLQYGTLFVRVNLADGSTLDIPTNPRKDWTFHPDPRVEIAVHLLSRTPDQASMHPIPFEFLFTDEDVDFQPIEVGESVLSVGRFQPRPGQPGSGPLLSYGSIYMMPQFVGTRVVKPDSSVVEIVAYIVEWPTWGEPAGLQCSWPGGGKVSSRAMVKALACWAYYTVMSTSRMSLGSTVTCSPTARSTWITGWH